MTEQQAKTLKKRIAREAPQVEVESGLKNKTVWVLKLHDTRKHRKLNIVRVEEWKEIKFLWSL